MYMKFNSQSSYPSKTEYLFENVCDDSMPIADSYNMLKNCECGFDEEESIFTTMPMFGYAYVPTQKLTKTFTPCEGLKMGTIFPELVDPYSPGQAEQEMYYLMKKNEIGEGCNNGVI